MPSNDNKYKEEPLAVEAVTLRTLHTGLKDAVHASDVRHQSKLPPKKELISMGTFWTKAKEHAVRLAKERDRKEQKTVGKTSPSKLRVVTVDDTLAEFLSLRSRGFSQTRLADGRTVWAFPDTLVTSFFTNWAVANNLQKGKEILLDGPAGEQFKRLFSADLKSLGSGPTVKHADGTETKTSVLDASGNQINPFFMNKHMFVFAPHYPQKAKNTNGKYEVGREVIPREDHADLYDRMQREHGLLTDELKSARTKFKEALDKLAKLNGKKEMAAQVNDRNISGSIFTAETDLRSAKKAYVDLLNANRLAHCIV